MKPFFLENDNVDSSQRNVIFLIRGENADRPAAVAGMYVLDTVFSFATSICQFLNIIKGRFVKDVCKHLQISLPGIIRKIKWTCFALLVCV